MFHDFSCVAEQVTDILDPVLEIARMQKASAGGPDNETEIKTSCMERC